MWILSGGRLLTMALLFCSMAAGPFAESVANAGQRSSVYPGTDWVTRKPEEVGLSKAKLDALRDLVGGRGCVVRHGYLVYTWGDPSQSGDIASAVKPIISTLLFLAIQEGKLKSVDDKVADFEPRLKTLNGGKDAGITWRHLASQISGYGLAEKPGQAYSYNDFALALYYDLLTQKVFGDKGTHLLKTRLGDGLGFQDRYAFDAFGPGDRSGRLAISTRDLARFGLLYLRGGKWNGRQVLRQEFIRQAISCPIPANTPLTSGKDADMLPHQRSFGGTKNITRVGPGYYSFNWWLNRRNQAGEPLFVDAPPDAYVATGHGGMRMLWVIPSLDLIVTWNDATVEDHDLSPGNAASKCNRAALLIREAVVFSPRTRVNIVNGKWRLNGQITYPKAKAQGLLMNVRMVNSVFEDARKPEFDPEANTDKFVARIPEYFDNGVRAFTIGLQGGFPGYEGAVNSAFSPDGSLRPTYLSRVQRVIEACDGNGVVVILGCYYQRQDQILKDEEAVRTGVLQVAKWVHSHGYTNVLIEIANEFPHSGFDHAILRKPEGQAQLIRLVKRAAPGMLVSTSGIGDGKLPDEVAKEVDFLLIHFNGVALQEIPQRIGALKGYHKPIVCNEDDKKGEPAAQAAELSVANGASWGLMLEKWNQHFPFHFQGTADDPAVYKKLKELTSP